MPALLIDEDGSFAVVRALRQHWPSVQVARAQEVGLVSTDDSIILDWASQRGLVVVSRDKRTMTSEAYRRVAAGEPMPGLVMLQSDASPGEQAADLAAIALAGRDADVDGQVLWIPLEVKCPSKP